MPTLHAMKRTNVLEPPAQMLPAPLGCGGNPGCPYDCKRRSGTIRNPFGSTSGRTTRDWGSGLPWRALRASTGGRAAVARAPSPSQLERRSIRRTVRRRGPPASAHIQRPVPGEPRTVRRRLPVPERLGAVGRAGGSQAGYRMAAYGRLPVRLRGSPLSDGAALAEAGVVFVSFNFRL